MKKLRWLLARRCDWRLDSTLSAVTALVKLCHGSGFSLAIFGRPRFDDYDCYSGWLSTIGYLRSLAVGDLCSTLVRRVIDEYSMSMIAMALAVLLR